MRTKYGLSLGQPPMSIGGSWWPQRHPRHVSHGHSLQCSARLSVKSECEMDLVRVRRHGQCSWLKLLLARQLNERRQSGLLRSLLICDPQTLCNVLLIASSNIESPVSPTRRSLECTTAEPRDYSSVNRRGQAEFQLPVSPAPWTPSLRSA